MTDRNRTTADDLREDILKERLRAINEEIKKLYGFHDPVTPAQITEVGHALDTLRKINRSIGNN